MFELDLTQNVVANGAGVDRTTPKKAKSGDSINLLTLLQILRVWLNLYRRQILIYIEPVRLISRLTKNIDL